jgi:Tol biopolymer transport system component
MSRRTAGALVLVGLLAAGGCSLSSAKKSSAGPGHIVFTRAGRTFGEETVFTARADGRQVKQIGEPMTTCCPRLSPDGRTIVVTGLAPDGARETAVLLNYDGSGVRQLPLPTSTLNLGAGAWSPDSKRLALQGWDDTTPGQDGIYLTDPDGTHLARISTTPDGGGADSPIDYAPDGRTLLVFRESAVQSVGSLWTLEIGNRHWARVTPPDLKVAIGGRWSPDGSTIVFAAGRD